MRITILLFSFILLMTLSYAQQQNGDVNRDSVINIFDTTGLINYLYLGGEKPCEFAGSGIAYSDDM